MGRSKDIYYSSTQCVTLVANVEFTQVTRIQHTDGGVRDQLHQYASELNAFIF